VRPGHPIGEKHGITNGYDLIARPQTDAFAAPALRRDAYGRRAGWASPRISGKQLRGIPLVPADLHDFFAASAGVSGALIGLLFVAISVSAERLAKEGAEYQPHRIRAAAALTAFTNALMISLFGLLPGEKIGWTSMTVSVAGIAFVAATLLSLVRLRQVNIRTARDLLFLVGLIAVFAIQLAEGWAVIANPADSSGVDTIAFEVVVCFLIGIARSWELIGGPDIAFTREVTELVRQRERTLGPENSQ
jgi:hypothetical protein